MITIELEIVIVKDYAMSLSNTRDEAMHFIGNNPLQSQVTYDCISDIFPCGMSRYRCRVTSNITLFKGLKCARKGCN